MFIIKYFDTQVTQIDTKDPGLTNQNYSFIFETIISAVNYSEEVNSYFRFKLSLTLEDSATICHLSLSIYL